MDVTELSPDVDAGRLVGNRSERLSWRWSAWLAWRGLGIVGYVVVFPVTCIALGRAISPVVKVPPSGVSVRDELAAHRS